MATLKAQVDRRQQQLAKLQKTKTVTSAMDSKASKDARYVMRFKRRVEQIGNAQYPKVARARQITGDVRLMVIISRTGKLKATHLLQSSGSTLLDDFAKSTVRQAAPFGKFSRGMDVHELRIIRTWRFGDSISVQS